MSSVFEDIITPKNKPLSNPVTSQSVATWAAPKPADEMERGGTTTTAPANVTNNAANSQGVTPAVTPAPATATGQQKPMSYVDMLNRMYTPETAEEKAKRERKEKWYKTAAAIGDGISALANLYYTTKGAPNSYDGKNSMSERTRQLYDKLDKDRKENERWYLNHYMNAAKMDEDAKRYQDQLDYRDKQDAYRKEQDALNRQERAELAKYKKDQDALSREDRLEKEKNDFDLRREALEENKRHNRRTEAVSSANSKKGKENQTYRMVLGGGRHATIDKSALNAHNIAYVYNKIPATDRQNHNPGKPKYNNRGKLIGYEPPTQEQMLAAIGQFVGKHPEVQEAWKEVGGEISVPEKDGNSRPNSVTIQNGNATAQAVGGIYDPNKVVGGKKHSYRVGGNNSVTDI